jgi:exosome complex component RRP42
LYYILLIPYLLYRLKSGFDTRRIEGRSSGAMDFELLDYWDEGEDLDGKEAWPVCVTLNLVHM